MKNVITISRQHGSGGRTIGIKLAEKLGYKMYDKEIVSKIAENLNIDENAADAKSQNLEKSISAHMGGFIPFAGFSRSNTSSIEKVYKEQKEVIRKIAEEGNCVIIGRNSDAILEDYPNALRIYIRSTMDYRINRMYELGLSQNEFTDKEIENKELTLRSIEESLKNSDTSRAAHYTYFTGKTWGAASNYNLVIDTSVFTDDQCIDLICKALEMLNKEE